MRRAPLSRQRVDSARGAALVELAASLLMLVMVLVFTADFARVYHHVIDLENAARAGAQYGVTNSGDAPGMVTAAQAAAPGTALTATALQSCECRGNDGTLYPPPADCTFDCPDASPEQHLVVAVTVTASYLFQTFARIPGMRNTLTITRAATLRAE